MALKDAAGTPLGSEGSWDSGIKSAANADTLQTLLFLYAYRGLVGGVEAVLNRGVAIDAVEPRTGLTALHIAVGRNDLETAKYLVARGASFIPDRYGRLPTAIAVECAVSDDMSDYILEAEAEALGILSDD